MSTDADNRREYVSWDDVPTVAVNVPACPFCMSLKHIRTRTKANGDGSWTRWVVCSRCSERFKIVFEIPEEGMHGETNF